MKLKEKEIKKKFMKITGMNKYSEIRCLLFFFFLKILNFILFLNFT